MLFDSINLDHILRWIIGGTNSTFIRILFITFFPSHLKVISCNTVTVFPSALATPTDVSQSTKMPDTIFHPNPLKPSYVDTLKKCVSPPFSCRKIAMTQLQATYARQVFPCFDEPEFKARFTLHLARPANSTAISNTDLVSTAPLWVLFTNSFWSRGATEATRWLNTT